MMVPELTTLLPKSYLTDEIRLLKLDFPYLSEESSLKFQF
jgi:hypothetical protein